MNTGKTTRLRWEAAGRSGPIETSEDVVTVTLDGRPLLGIDLAGGGIGMWPDGEEWRGIGQFEPMPEAPLDAGLPTSPLVTAAVTSVNESLDAWHEAHTAPEDTTERGDSEQRAATELAGEVVRLLYAVALRDSGGPVFSVRATRSEITALREAVQLSGQAWFDWDRKPEDDLYRVDFVRPAAIVRGLLKHTIDFAERRRVHLDHLPALRSLVDRLPTD